MTLLILLIQQDYLASQSVLKLQEQHLGSEEHLEYMAITLMIHDSHGIAVGLRLRRSLLAQGLPLRHIMEVQEFILAAIIVVM